VAVSVAAAIAKAKRREGERFDRAAGYLPPPPKPAPTPRHIRTAFESVDQNRIDHLVYWLIKETRCSEADAREATQDTFEKLLRKRPEVFHRDTEEWWRILYEIAPYRVSEIRFARHQIVLVDSLVESVGAAATDTERPSLPISPAACDYTWVEPPSEGEAWVRIQIIGAFQRYARHYGKQPREIDCRALHRLPSPGEIRACFGTFGAALAAAGMRGQRRPRTTHLEAAEQCLSFKRRNGRWPDTRDFRRCEGDLPREKVARRIFGSTRPGVVQQQAEEILRLAKGRKRS